MGWRVRECMAKPKFYFLWGGGRFLELILRLFNSAERRKPGVTLCVSKDRIITHCRCKFYTVCKFYTECNRSPILARLLHLARIMPGSHPGMLLALCEYDAIMHCRCNFYMHVIFIWCAILLCKFYMHVIFTHPQKILDRWKIYAIVQADL